MNDTIERRHQPIAYPNKQREGDNFALPESQNNYVDKKAGEEKANLIIRADDPTVTMRDLRNIIARSGQIFDRGGPVQIIPQDDGLPRVCRLIPENVVILAHTLARPVTIGNDGKPTARPLPDRVARLYLAGGHWGLAPLRGMASTPLLSDDGSLLTVEGYDPISGLWLCHIPLLRVPETPNYSEAVAALRNLRCAFQTFPFADTLPQDDEVGDCGRLSSPPGQDETAFLAALLTAACRPSLPRAPGLLITGPAVSGAGVGKGILVRAICAIAFGIEPYAFTVGNSKQDTAELDKRIASALMEAAPIIFIDNANGLTLRSDLMASVLTERHISVRPLGVSETRRLSSNAYVAITGNGVHLSEDLARRFLLVELDARMENPEERRFAPGFLKGIIARRAELLTHILTIWRWGRLNENSLAYGRSLGSFEEWSRWVRDPLLALGCVDPVERLRAIKARDPSRRALIDILQEIWLSHKDRPFKASELNESVCKLIDPQEKGRQFVASFLQRHIGTRVGEFLLTAQRGGRWSATTYALNRVERKPATTPL